jgi:hypothetical protein
VAPDDPEGRVRGVVAMGRFGCNCSLPHKDAVMAFLDDLFAQCGCLARRTSPVLLGDVTRSDEGKTLEEIVHLV